MSSENLSMALSPRRRQRWSVLPSLLSLLPVFLILPWFTHRKHYALPPPNLDQTDSLGRPQLSEKAILGHAYHLSEVIGFRTVGSREHALADAWMVEQATLLVEECQRVAKAENRKLECEVWRQSGDGAHRFDMMDKRVYKNYVQLSNIIVRVSDGTPEGKQHAVLVNSHLDSTLPSPGAADDAVPVGIMIECIRVLIHNPGWEPAHAIIFLFNNAEESLQDGSQLYSTQHETAPTVRAVINLEAAGTTGPELLFQATSHEMIKAYSHVPRPYGTVLANDIFSSGILMSDTDFRQFQAYLNVTGLDMAIVGNSYMYHTRKDLVKNFEPGAAQHMADNVIVLLRYLSSKESMLPTLSTYSRPKTVFFSLLGTYFLMYSFETAAMLHLALLGASVVLASATVDFSHWALYLRAFFGVFGSFIGSILGANIVAFIMSSVLGKGLSWFTHEQLCALIYGPPAMAGILLTQLLVSQRLPLTLVRTLEHATFVALQIFFIVGALLLQHFGLGSSSIFFIFGTSAFVALVANTVIQLSASAPVGEVDSLVVYALGQIPSLLLGTEVFLALTDVFVPLTGRMGGEAPTEHIIATIVGAIGFFFAPYAAAFAHRFGRRLLLTTVLGLSLLSVLMIAIFAVKSPFDSTHQKRLFVMHVENITTLEHHLHLAHADGAPGFDQLVRDISLEFGEVSANSTLVPVTMNEYNGDWDALYPFSQFLTPFKFPVPVPPSYISPWSSGERFTVKAVNDRFDWTTRTRNLTLSITHPGIIWPVIAFDAQVLEWSLDDHPPSYYTRHHIKGASFYGIHSCTIDLSLKIQPNSSGEIKIALSGLIERGMWPHKKAEREGPSMDIFEKLDTWLFETTGDTVDAMLLSSVAGNVIV